MTTLLDPIVVDQSAVNESIALNPSGPRAMVICHGMGQQTPFETLDSVVKALAQKHGSDINVALRFVRFADGSQPVPRAELTLRRKDKPDVNLHLYEAYWAPLTEGVISYIQTAIFLIKSGWHGLRASFKGKFDRWMFGDKRWLPVDKSTTLLLIALLVTLFPLLVGAGLIGWIGYLFKLSFTSGFSWVGILTKIPHLIALALLAAGLWKFRSFMLQYLGDVAIYVSSHEVNRFWNVRHEIKQIGVSLAQRVYRAADGQAGNKRFAYSNVIFVGHSLGSVVAYDTLNTLIRDDQINQQTASILSRTYALVTFGSPLDKIAFLFRQKTKNPVARDTLAAGVQPMIQSYALRPPWWINVFCRRDVVSGALEYFDNPGDLSDSRRARNFEDPYRGVNPVAAHTDYWNREPTSELLYRAAIGTFEDLDQKTDSCREQDRRHVEQKD